MVDTLIKTFWNGRYFDPNLLEWYFELAREHVLISEAPMEDLENKAADESTEAEQFYQE